MTVLVNVSTTVWVTRERDPDDPWSNESTDGYVSDVDVFFTEDGADSVFFMAEKFGDGEAGELAVGDTAYVVVADYSSGDTFGTYGGRFQVLNVFRDSEKAAALVRAAEAVKYGEFSFAVDGTDYHVSWTGYFESLREVRSWEVVVRHAQ